MHKLWLVGGGSGQPDYLLPLAKQVLEQADCVIASERFLKLAAGKKMTLFADFITDTDDQEVSFTSSRSSVVKVNENGVVKAGKKTGKAVITVTAESLLLLPTNAGLLSRLSSDLCHVTLTPASHHAAFRSPARSISGVH